MSCCLNPMDCSTPGFPILHQLGACSNSCPLSPWCHPTISSSATPSIFPRIRIFPSESILRIRWPKYWNLSFSMSSSNAYSGLIFFGFWFALLAVQGTLKSPNLKASIQFQHQSLQLIFGLDFLLDWQVWSPCSPRNSQDSSPAPRFESINSSWS